MKLPPDLLKLFGTDLVDGLKQKIRKDLKIVNKELPLDTEYKIRDTIKVRCYTLTFF